MFEAWKLKPMDGYTTCEVIHLSKTDFGPNFGDRLVGIATESRPFIANSKFLFAPQVVLWGLSSFDTFTESFAFSVGISDTLDRCSSLSDELFVPLTNQDELSFNMDRSSTPPETKEVVESVQPEAQIGQPVAIDKEDSDKDQDDTQDMERASDAATAESTNEANLTAHQYAGVLARADAHFSSVFASSSRWKSLKVSNGLDCRIKFTEGRRSSGIHFPPSC